MAQFMGTVRGNRGKISRLGSKSSGLRTTCNGWSKGIEVFAEHFNGRDVFEVFETGGSNGGRGRLIATIE
jgi:hypothetical protein